MIRYIAENDDDELTLHETSARAYLVLLTDGRISHSFPLRDQHIDIGRDKGNSIVVADQKVSRHHVTLTPIDDTFILADKGSANGTYLNGVLVSQAIRLKDQDKITVGDTTFLFSIEMPETDTLYDHHAPAPSRPSAQPAPPTSQATPFLDKPIWLIIGCMGLVIVGLLIVLAVLLGLFIGQGQTAGMPPNGEAIQYAAEILEFVRTQMA